jgi:hypothetical protein
MIYLRRALSSLRLFLGGTALSRKRRIELPESFAGGKAWPS